MATKPQSEFAMVFTKLRAIAKKYARGGLKPKPDSPRKYILVGPPTAATRGREMWFGGVVRGKAYVSYHLIGVYAFPELLQDMSPALRKRMQGKSCFNFTKVDPAAFQELASVTDRAYRRMKQHGFIRG